MLFISNAFWILARDTARKAHVPIKGKRQPQTVLTAWLVEILPRVVGYHL